jgi:hypothetical protein
VKNSWMSAVALDLLSRSSRGSLMSLMSMMEVCETLEVRDIFGFLVCGAGSGISSDVVGEMTMTLSRVAELQIE